MRPNKSQVEYDLKNIMMGGQNQTCAESILGHLCFLNSWSGACPTVLQQLLVKQMKARRCDIIVLENGKNKQTKNTTSMGSTHGSSTC